MRTPRRWAQGLGRRPFSVKKNPQQPLGAGDGNLPKPRQLLPHWRGIVKRNRQNRVHGSESNDKIQNSAVSFYRFSHQRAHAAGVSAVAQAFNDFRASLPLSMMRFVS